MQPPCRAEPTFTLHTNKTLSFLLLIHWICTGVEVHLSRPHQKVLAFWRVCAVWLEYCCSFPQWLNWCLVMVVAFSRSGCRKWAPHPVEVEAILQNNTKISHKICFPNETELVSTYLFSQPWPLFQPWCAHPGACVKTFNILISYSPLCNKSLVIS